MAMALGAAPAARAVERIPLITERKEPERVSLIQQIQKSFERIRLITQEETQPTEPTEESTATTGPAETLAATEPTQALETTEPTEAATEETTQPTEPEYPWQDPWENLKKYLPFYQADYPNVRYGNGTIATSGCGITSLAMVANYMTGHCYTPEQLANWFGGYNASNTDRMLNAASKLQLPWHQAKDWHEAYEALKIGCPVIVLENELSKFTQNQHFIVLVGITEDDRVVVLDSARANYDLWDLKDGFERGFTQAEICAGYSGSWIFDVHAMSDEPFIYQEAPRPDIVNRYPDIQLTLEEENLLARVIWVEARGESAKGQQAVAEVVLNRILSQDFPDNLHDVIYQEGQFRSVPFLEDAEPNQTQYDAIKNALQGPYILPTEVVHFATYAETPYIWDEIGGHIFCYATDPEAPDTIQDPTQTEETLPLIQEEVPANP